MDETTCRRTNVTAPPRSLFALQSVCAQYDPNHRYRLVPSILAHSRAIVQLYGCVGALQCGGAVACRPRHTRRNPCEFEARSGSLDPFFSRTLTNPVKQHSHVNFTSSRLNIDRIQRWAHTRPTASALRLHPPLHPRPPHGRSAHSPRIPPSPPRALARQRARAPPFHLMRAPRNLRSEAPRSRRSQVSKTPTTH